MRSVRLVVAVSIGVAGCAHGPVARTGRGVDEDLDARAYAAFHTMQATPYASVYVLEGLGAPASDDLVKRVAQLSRLKRRGFELYRTGTGGPSKLRVVLSVGSPAWSASVGSDASFRRASVETSYRMGEGEVVHCKVQVAPDPGGGPWSMRTPSDVPCWPKSK